MAVNLTIDPATIRIFAEKARAINAMAGADTYQDGGEKETEFDMDTLSERHGHDGLQEEESEDLTREELIELIDDLNVDEAAEVVAIAWIGRGDLEVADWLANVAEAKSRAVGPTSKYLIGMPMLADYLEEGLQSLGL